MVGAGAGVTVAAPAGAARSREAARPSSFERWLRMGVGIHLRCGDEGLAGPPNVAVLG
jgi:hypothetical protein